MILWVMTALFALLSGVLLSGRGGFLIAGYNTASKAEKEKYDEKKLCRITGGGMAVITILLFLMALFGDDMPYWLEAAVPAVILVDIAVMMILLNIKGKAKPGKDGNKTAAGEKNRSSSLVKWGSAGFTVLILAVTAVLLFTGEVKVAVQGEEITIQVSYWPDKEIPLEEIQSVTYEENVSFGRRTNGFGGLRLLAGHFENTEYGKYLLYAYKPCRALAVLETTEGIIGINAPTEQETKELYQMLKEEIS